MQKIIGQKKLEGLVSMYIHMCILTDFMIYRLSLKLVYIKSFDYAVD